MAKLLSVLRGNASCSWEILIKLLWAKCLTFSVIVITNEQISNEANKVGVCLQEDVWLISYTNLYYPRLVEWLHRRISSSAKYFRKPFYEYFGFTYYCKWLTGEQNSSNAGLTNVIYWLRICSKSRPRSVKSRTTESKRVQIINFKRFLYKKVWKGSDQRNCHIIDSKDFLVALLLLEMFRVIYLVL